MIISDASVQKSGQSGFAWLIANDHTIVWCGNGLAPGPEDDTYSGRAEAYGLLAAIMFLEFYVQCYDYQIPPQTIPCYCDNSGVITNLTSMQNTMTVRPNKTMNNDHDIYAEITAMATKCCPLRLHYIHVKGHQDNQKDQQLTIEETHNVDCDSTAKQYVQTCQTQSTTLGHPEFESAQPHLIIDGKVICRQVLLAL